MDKESQGNALSMAICNTMGERRIAVSSTCEHHYPGPTRSARDMFLHDTFGEPGGSPYRKEKGKGIFHEDSRDALMYFAISRWKPIWADHTKWAA
ncbi:MAG: hypothetical protein GY854_01845 [Deltaproteobacteria bacterium]|nr:hypothetical protein [Deltaproteobacteria bacterium]